MAHQSRLRYAGQMAVFHPPEPFGHASGNDQIGASRPFPAAKAERPLWLSKASFAADG